MTTPDVQSNSIETDAPSQGAVPDPFTVGRLASDTGEGIIASAETDWISTASFIFGGIVAVGFLVVIFGEYVIPNLVVVLVGTAIISLAGIGWGVAALILIFRLAKRWFTSDAVVRK